MSNLLDTDLTRQGMLKVGASSSAAIGSAPRCIGPTNVQAQSKVQPRGSARFVIFVMLDGGQSHVDSWDLKERKWTPQDFDIKEIAAGRQVAHEPLSAAWTKQSTSFTGPFDRGLGQRALRAQYYVQSAHMLNPGAAERNSTPSDPSSHTSRARRRPTDTLLVTSPST